MGKLTPTFCCCEDYMRSLCDVQAVWHIVSLQVIADFGDVKHWIIFSVLLSWLGNCSPCIFATIGLPMQKNKVNQVGSARAQVAMCGFWNRIPGHFFLNTSKVLSNSNEERGVRTDA